MLSGHLKCQQHFPTIVSRPCCCCCCWQQRRTSSVAGAPTILADGAGQHAVVVLCSQSLCFRPGRAEAAALRQQALPAVHIGAQVCLAPLHPAPHHHPSPRLPAHCAILRVHAACLSAYTASIHSVAKKAFVATLLFLVQRVAPTLNPGPACCACRAACQRGVRSGCRAARCSCGSGCGSQRRRRPCQAARAAAPPGTRPRMRCPRWSPAPSACWAGRPGWPRPSGRTGALRQPLKKTPKARSRAPCQCMHACLQGCIHLLTCGPAQRHMALCALTACHMAHQGVSLQTGAAAEQGAW